MGVHQTQRKSQAWELAHAKTRKCRAFRKIGIRCGATEEIRLQAENEDMKMARRYMNRR